jgi:hypothetical protein
MMRLIMFLRRRPELKNAEEMDISPDVAAQFVKI